MDLELRGKTALVFGASGGLGGAVAETLANEGAKVALAGRGTDILRAKAEQLQAVTETFAVEWDLSDHTGIPDRVEAIKDQLGGVDILVNMTGGPPPTPVSGQPLATWATHFNSMVVSVIAITDAILPHMRERQWGRVITSTSSGVVAPIPNLGLSNALRSSLVAWSKTLAREVGGDGVTSNIVVPGRIATQRIVALDGAKADREGRHVDDVAAESIAAIPVGRYGDTREYADVVAFLASSRSSYVTGSVLRVDGGLIPSI
jgi:3-oxoacyl-[acyl-carrier protein] reductase